MPQIEKTVAVLVRVRPAAKELLVQAAKEQRRSQASVVEELILQNLDQYKGVGDRLNALIQATNTDALREPSDDPTSGESGS